MFKEFSQELIYFVKRLHDELEADGEKTVHFFAREGQFLKTVFDLVCLENGSDICSKYMQVSRSSTFLPSLAAIENEQFETLFRQYTDISPAQFMKSLGLDEFSKGFIHDLGVDEGTWNTAHTSFQNTELFKKIRCNLSFRQIYEEQRVSQQRILKEYFLDGLDENENICIVDVGWKGTIQDHLFKAFNASSAPKKIMKGYYVGLLWPTNCSDENHKKGLLFDRDHLSRSKHYWVFNENRALYELLLSADHGSAKSYTKENNVISVEEQEFVEKEQFEKIIGPIQQSLLADVQKAIVEKEISGVNLNSIAKHHQRIVFNPSKDELACFESLFQFENFGLFENTHFLSKAKGIGGFVSIVKALITGDDSSFGFWPYAYIKNHYGVGLAKLYYLKQRFLTK